MAQILDLTSSLRKKFWGLWVKLRRNLKPPEDLDQMPPEKAYRVGLRRGFWEGALASAKVLSSPDQEDDSPNS